MSIPAEKTVGSVMVVGGGIAGVQASLDLADSGYYVYLVEKSSAIGGVMSQLDKTFPTNDCSMCILSPKLVDCGKNLNIELLILSEVESVSGEAGNFSVKVIKHPRYVDPDKCTGCGICAEKCPVKIPDEYDMGLSKRKSIYVKYPQAVPLKYVIDDSKCLRLAKGKKCGVCEKRCTSGAVNFEDKEEKVDLNVGSIILSSGFKPFDPASYDTYGYGKYPNVVTSMELERLLSASGPDQGHLLKPSNKKHPEKIAWLQCVGSRDQNHCKNTYCSAVCCMYAIKEAVIAKEHAGHPLDTAIFFMDMRTYGKEFEKYYNRAQEEQGVRFIRSRIHTIDPVGDEGERLRLIFTDEDRQIREEDFDMVVLSVGLEPDKEVVALTERLGIKLNEHRFCKTDGFEPVKTSKEGIFVCGALQGPKDIPYSVMESSAAACEASVALARARGTLTKTREVPPEINIAGQPPRIGVWVCHCGVNIASVVDVAAVKDYAAGLPFVEYVENALYTCSQDTQEKMKEIIREKGLNRIVVAACTPRTHEPLFRDTCRDAGLNKFLFEMANIRDQCSWVHQNEPEASTEKAKDLVRMAVAKSARLAPLREVDLPVNHDALIIGGGVAGMESALALADQGFKVSLVEKSDRLGGNALKLRHNFQGQEVAPYLDSLIEKVSSHENITVHLNSEIDSVSGFVGNFKSAIRNPQSTIEIEHGVAIIAVGAQAHIPKGEYLYGEDDRVMTSQEWDERLANPQSEQSAIPGTHEVGAQSAIFIQCVGSRCIERPYCSKVCCTHTVETATSLKEQNPDMDIYVLYRDVRTYGFNENLYLEARSKGVTFIRYREDDKPEVKKTDSGLEVLVTDPVLGRKVRLQADLVCLAPAIIANPVKDLAQHFKVPLNNDGFFLEAHMKLRPVDFATDGVFVAGLAHYPKPMDEAIAQAKAAASRAGTVLSRKVIMAGGEIAYIVQSLCAGCGLCENVCAYKAIEMNEEGKAEIKEALCKGCGTCVATCRMGAPKLYGFSDEQVLAMIEAC
ncbi:MAG: FAD-dependent oxidoreductase [bacterium]|nr:FAD-dependent oxidoreductase [bacterium]